MAHFKVLTFFLLLIIFFLATTKPTIWATSRAYDGPPWNQIINVEHAPVGRKFASAAQVNRLPKHFDSRQQWPRCAKIIGDVRHQGTCGSCWAMITTAVAADRFCIATKGKIQVRLSPWHLLQCCGLGSCADGKVDFGGCAGGDPWGTWRYFVEHGVVTESCKPYPDWVRWYGVNTFDSDEVQCEAACEDGSIDIKQNRYYAKSFYRLPNHEGTIRKEIFDHGPVVTHINIASPHLNTHQHDGSIIFKCTDNSIATHGVRLLGWGEQDGKPYWLAVNSWDRHWGINGTFKIARGENSCHVEEFVTAMIPRIQ